VTIEDDFREKTLEAIANLDFNTDVPDDVLLSNLITDLQVRAYAMGKMTDAPVEEVDEDITYDPKFDYSTVGFGDNNRLIDCFDCGATLNSSVIAIHENFHIELNRATGSVVSGYFAEVEDDNDD